MFVALMMQLTKYTKQCRGCRIRGNGTGLDGHMVQHGAADVLPTAYLSIAFGLTNTNVQCTHTHWRHLQLPYIIFVRFTPVYCCIYAARNNFAEPLLVVVALSL